MFFYILLLIIESVSFISIFLAVTSEVVTTAMSLQLQVPPYLHDGLLVREEVAKQ